MKFGLTVPSQALRDAYPDPAERARALLAATRTMLARHEARMTARARADI